MGGRTSCLPFSTKKRDVGLGAGSKLSRVRDVAFPGTALIISATLPIIVLENTHTAYSICAGTYKERV